MKRRNHYRSECATIARLVQFKISMNHIVKQIYIYIYTCIYIQCIYRHRNDGLYNSIYNHINMYIYKHIYLFMWHRFTTNEAAYSRRASSDVAETRRPAIMSVNSDEPTHSTTIHHCCQLIPLQITQSVRIACVLYSTLFLFLMYYLLHTHTYTYMYKYISIHM